MKDLIIQIYGLSVKVMIIFMQELDPAIYTGEALHQETGPYAVQLILMPA